MELKQAMELLGKALGIEEQTDGCPVKEAYETVYDALGWCNGEWSAPCHDEEQWYLVIVDGKYENITFESAIQLAEYDPADGWSIEGYEEWDNPPVKYWKRLPPLPEEGGIE